MSKVTHTKVTYPKLFITDNQTGKTGLYSNFRGYEIMFHVAPWIPLPLTDIEKVLSTHANEHSLTVTPHTGSQKEIRCE